MLTRISSNLGCKWFSGSSMHRSGGVNSSGARIRDISARKASSPSDMRLRLIGFLKYFSLEPIEILADSDADVNVDAPVFTMEVLAGTGWKSISSSPERTSRQACLIRRN